MKRKLVLLSFLTMLVFVFNARPIAAQDEPSASDKVAEGHEALISKNYDAAIEAFNIAEQMDPGNRDIYHYRGEALLAKGDAANALKDLQKAIEMDPQEPHAHYDAGLAYNKLHQQDKMVNELQTFVRLAPNAPEAPKIRSLLQGI